MVEVFSLHINKILLEALCWPPWLVFHRAGVRVVFKESNHGFLPLLSKRTAPFPVQGEGIFVDSLESVVRV